MHGATVLLLLCPLGQVLAQDTDTKLVIQQGGREIGREEFTLSGGRARGAPGSSLRANARYPSDTPTLRLAATLERTAVAKGSEAGRELPGGRDVVLLDDGVFSLYIAVADMATAEGKALTAVFPRTARRASFVARREGGADKGNARVTLTGDIRGFLETDAQGRLVRLELPSTGIVVIRARD
jgi:hypothetical protein